MDVNISHQFAPNRKGTCQLVVGGRKRGYKHCGLPADALVHQRWEREQQAAAAERAQQSQPVHSVPYEHTVYNMGTATLRSLRDELQYNHERGVDHVPLSVLLALVIALEDLND